MRYLVTARVSPARKPRFATRSLKGPSAKGPLRANEYLRNMENARADDAGRVKWVEVCYCSTPLAEEREYWEEHFDLEKVQDAHARTRCRDLSGQESWACGDCDCSAKLEARLAARGESFLEKLRNNS